MYIGQPTLPDLAFMGEQALLPAPVLPCEQQFKTQKSGVERQMTSSLPTERLKYSGIPASMGHRQLSRSPRIFSNCHGGKPRRGMTSSRLCLLGEHLKGSRRMTLTSRWITVTKEILRGDMSCCNLRFQRRRQCHHRLQGHWQWDDVNMQHVNVVDYKLSLNA